MSNFYLDIIAEREYLKDSAMEKERTVPNPNRRRPGKRSRHPESAVTAPKPKIGKRTDGAATGLPRPCKRCRGCSGSRDRRFIKTKTTTCDPDESVSPSLFSRICLRALFPPRRHFFVFGASIMFIFLPSSRGIASTLANSSRSVAKRSSRISPCSLKTIERPRKKT